MPTSFVMLLRVSMCGKGRRVSCQNKDAMPQSEREQASCHVEKERQWEQGERQQGLLSRIKLQTPTCFFIDESKTNHSLISSGMRANEEGKKPKNEWKRLLYVDTNTFFPFSAHRNAQEIDSITQRKRDHTGRSPRMYIHTDTNYEHEGETM